MVNHSHLLQAPVHTKAAPWGVANAPIYGHASERRGMDRRKFKGSRRGLRLEVPSDNESQSIKTNIVAWPRAFQAQQVFYFTSQIKECWQE
jgi:hypothetical protein